MLTGYGDDARLAALREGTEEPEAADIVLRTELARALGFAWEIEGGALNEVADVLEGAAPLDPARDHLIELLKELAAAAQRSAALLEATRP